jgi:acarbose 7IV-phosphotransferase
MSNILVSGLINIETTLKVDSFPLTYEPVRYPFWGVNSTVSGVGYNVARALTTLGDEVSFFSLSGKDLLGEAVQTALAQDAIPARHVLPLLDQTAQSVIIYEPSGRRQIHVDLKNIQEFEYPLHRFTEALPVCDLAVLCNINFSRPFLAAAQAAAKPIATDVHTISDLDDAYNQDFMAAAHILFMSNEKLPCSPEEWARRLQNRYGTPSSSLAWAARARCWPLKTTTSWNVCRPSSPVPSSTPSARAMLCFPASSTSSARPMTPIWRCGRRWYLLLTRLGKPGRRRDF